MVRTSFARLALTCAGLLLAVSGAAQTPPANGGDTVNPWNGTGEPPKESGDTVNPWKGGGADPKAAQVAAGDKGAAAKPAAIKAGRRTAPVTRRRGRNGKPVSWDGPIAGAPSFRMLEGGVSRIFLEVSRKVEVTEHKAKGRVVYSLKGAQAPTATNRLPLLTGFFVTPVDRVELFEQGDGVDLAVDLREDLAPHFEVIETPRGMVLTIDIPRGSSGPKVDGAAPPSDAPAGATRSTATKRLEGPATPRSGDGG